MVKNGKWVMPAVAGVYAPAFVERPRCSPAGCAPARAVAGVYAPAFVERT